MKLRILIMLLIAFSVVSCGKKKKGALLLLPSLESPALNNTVETPVEEVAPTPDTFQHPVVVESEETTGGESDNSGTTTENSTGTTGTETTTGNGTGSGGTETTTGNGTTPPTGNGGLEGSEANPEVAVINVSESEFRTDGIPVTDCIKNLPVPTPGKSGMIKYDDFTKNLCEIDGVWYVVIPWNFADGNFKMHIEKKIPKAKYLLSGMFGTYDVDGYRDLMYPQRRASAPYNPVYNVDYTSQNWLITSQDVFLIDIPTQQWINFDRNYALFRVFVDDTEVTTEDSRSGLHLKTSTLVYDIPPPPSTMAAYLLQSNGGTSFAQTISLSLLAIGIAGLIVYIARLKRES